MGEVAAGKEGKLYVCGGQRHTTQKFRLFPTRSHLPVCSSDAVPTPSNRSAAPAPAGGWNYSREARSCGERRRAEPGSEEEQARSRQTQGQFGPAVRRQRLCPPTGPQWGDWSQHTLCWLGKGGQGFLRLPLRDTMPLPTSLRTISLKNNLKAKHRDSGSAFPVFSLRSLNPRGRL